jgi:hypothetical protein
MICPYCQTELDTRDIACPRCGAPLPGNTTSLGRHLRLYAVIGFLTVMLALILSTCILPRLPGGGGGPEAYRPDEVQRALQQLQSHQQGNQNPGPQPLQK